MSTSLIHPGDRLLVVHRRLFEKDENRLFIGEVQGYDSGVLRVEGYSFVRNTLSGTINRKADLRTKLISLTSGTLLIYVLPLTVQIDKVEVRCDETQTWLTDNAEFEMNLSEWTYRAH